MSNLVAIAYPEESNEAELQEALVKGAAAQ
jgi:hypothetical protein